LLLLDARTGISSTNLVTTRVLADDVIALTLDSREQLEGTRSVLRSLAPLTSLRTQEALKLHVVLSRVEGRHADVGSYKLTDEEREQIARVRTFLQEPADPLRATLTIDRVHMLHSEPSLVRGDVLTLAQSRLPETVALHVDWLRIAEAVLPDEAREIAARAISERSDPHQRESLARFFARPDEIAEARAAVLTGAEKPLSATQPDLAEHVQLLEQVVVRDPTRRPDLARALLDLAAGHVAVGRRADAVEPTERAVAIYEELAATNPAFLNDLACSLNNLGNRYREIGRRADAIAPTERAVAICEELAATNPAFLNDLAMSLNNLGNRYREIGRLAEAVERIARAVAIYEELAAANPAFLNGLAMSLNNLGNVYSEVGGHDDAVTPTERAVTIYEELAATNPAFLNDLAGSQNNLGYSYSEIGRRADAVEPTERAVAIREKIAATNPAFCNDLAMSLNNLGNVYSEVGRLADAVEPTERAVAIYEKLAATNPAFLNDLANSLNNLAVLRAAASKHEDGLAAISRAVELRRTHARELPAVGVPLLAATLRTLATLLEAAGEQERARAAAQESERLYAELIGNE
jgi:tetratricopeptide (TPR) repeat protein